MESKPYSRSNFRMMGSPQIYTALYCSQALTFIVTILYRVFHIGDAPVFIVSAIC